MRVGMNWSALTPHFDIRGFKSSRRPFGAAKFISAVLTYMASGSLLADISVLILSSKWSGISSWVTLIFGYLAMKSASYFLTREFSVGLPPQFAARIVPVTSASLVAPPPALLPPPQAASSTDPTAASAKPSRIDRMNSPPGTSRPLQRPGARLPIGIPYSINGGRPPVDLREAPFGIIRHPLRWSAPGEFISMSLVGPVFSGAPVAIARRHLPAFCFLRHHTGR